MFERFTNEARQAVAGAQSEAQRLHHRHICTEHLLLALLTQDTASTPGLFRYGLTHHGVPNPNRAPRGGEDLGADARTTLGIDLDVVRDRVEATFGPGALDAVGRRGEVPSGHIPFSPRAKKVLELSLREAIAMKSKSIRDGHIALGLLREGEGPAMKVPADRGIGLTELRRDLTAALRD